MDTDAVSKRRLMPTLLVSLISNKPSCVCTDAGQTMTLVESTQSITDVFNEHGCAGLLLENRKCTLLSIKPYSASIFLSKQIKKTQNILNTNFSSCKLTLLPLSKLVYTDKITYNIIR